VMVARALAQRPKVLILDEPTNHLDIRHQLEVLSLVRDLGCTVICSLHDLTLASEYADLALVLSRGKTVSFGEPKGILTALLIKQTYNVTAQIDRANGASRFSYHL
jgi:iron complex transport system ATP-binding protein